VYVCLYELRDIAVCMVMCVLGVCIELVRVRVRIGLDEQRGEGCYSFIHFVSTEYGN
jgi:hypothetical protein